MQEIEKITCIKLYKKLKDKVRGKIFTSIRNDILTVYINEGRDIRYTYTINNISKGILIDGLTAGDIAHKVLKDYKNFIMNKYLY